MEAVLGYLRAHIAEIERDSALRWYGVALTILHVVADLYWVDHRIAAFVHAALATNAAVSAKDGSLKVSGSSRNPSGILGGTILAESSRQGEGHLRVVPR